MSECKITITVAALSSTPPASPAVCNCRMKNGEHDSWCDAYRPASPAAASERAHVCGDQAVAFLRQRLEEANQTGENLHAKWRETEAHLAQVQQERDSWRRVSERLETEKSQAEAALEEMQKWVENYLKELDGDYPSPDREVLQEVLAELQRRRSPTE